jgi:hypothetical protein
LNKLENTWRKLLRALSPWPYQPPSSYFSCGFIQKEIKEAVNIKEKGNKKNVMRILTIINTILKTTTIEENGFLLFVGIDREGKEVKHMITPMNPITEFYYTCSKKFEIDQFLSLFTSIPMGNVVFISGEECYIYQYTGCWKKIKSLNGNLIKRQKKGGQSSVRFSRLAEESRAHYITYIVGWINQLLSHSNNYVFGSRELKDMLLSDINLKPMLKTDDLYHVFDDKTIQESFFKQLMISPIFAENRKVDEVVELLQRDPDYLLFSVNEVQEYHYNVDYIITVHEDIKIASHTLIKIPMNHKHYATFKNYTLIAKLYIKN